MSTRTLLTRRGHLAEISWQDSLHDGAPLPKPGSVPGGSVLVRVEAVAFTANTLTYGLLGEQLRYWEFFPTVRAGWGCLPAWGTGVVQDSAAPELPAGSRVFGLLPIATHCLLAPVRVTPASLRDSSEHRLGLPPAYQHYDRLAPAAGGGATAPDDDEALGALLQPLFMLGFLLAGQLLARPPTADGSTVVLTAASSKTAQAVAQQLQGSGLRVVGLTSPAHVASCTATGLFASVLAYPAVDTITEHTAGGELVLVDIAGDTSLRARVRVVASGRDVHTVLVGAAHRTPGRALVATPAEEVFSTVDRLRLLARDLGAEELRRRQQRAWQSYLQRTRDRVILLRAHGPSGIDRAYREVLDGRCPPEHGHLLSVDPP